jgi:GMP synthase (glutamine-hydrolysing)
MHAVLNELNVQTDYLPAGQVFTGDRWQALGHQVDGWIFLGGEMNVDEDDAYPYLAVEKRALQHLLSQDTPVLGICLGSQLMARALGAPVTRMPQTEVGWQPLTLTPAGRNDACMALLADGYQPFQWHNDTFSQAALPQTITNLASTAQCSHQAFRVGRHGLAVQFHPEVSRSQIDAWLSSSSSLSEPEKALLQQQTDALFDQQAAITQQWFAAYVKASYPALAMVPHAAR